MNHPSARLAATLLPLLVAGCGLLDGLNGPSAVTGDQFCERLSSRLAECPDGAEPADGECEDAFACIREVVECQEQADDLVQCVFDDGSEPCAPDSAGGALDFSFCVNEAQALNDCLANQPEAELPPSCSGGGIGPPICGPDDPLCTPVCEGAGCPSEGEPCADLGCPSDLRCLPLGDPMATCQRGCIDDGCAVGVCNSSTGACEVEPGTQCEVDDDCGTGGPACLSTLEVCERTTGRFGPYRDETCAGRSSDRVCRARCTAGIDCAEGERCEAVQQTPGLPASGFCMPGLCDDNSECPDGLACLDVSNGPSSGTCGVPCEPSACGADCPDCPVELPSCQWLGRASDGQAVFSCTEGTLAAGEPCPELDQQYSCGPGLQCLTALSNLIPAEQTCARFCDGTTPECDECEPFLPDDTRGLCVSVGGPGDTCVADGDSCNGGNGRCLIPVNACQGDPSAYLPDGGACADWFDSNLLCSNRCDPTAPACGPDERCWSLNPADPNSDEGFCAPGQCETPAECGNGNSVCLPQPGGMGVTGVCMLGCNPAGCGDGLDCTCAAGQSCNVLHGGGEWFAFCEPNGPGLLNEACSIGSSSCEPGLSCIADDPTMAPSGLCRELCSIDNPTCSLDDCLLILPDVTGPEGAESSGTCGDAVGGGCVDCVDDCIDMMSQCTSEPDVFPTSPACGSLPNEACGEPCDPLSGLSSCPTGDHCYRANLAATPDVGVCLPGECDGNIDCVAAGSVCVLRGGVSDGGLCAKTCNPEDCIGTVCDCGGDTCAPLLSADETEVHFGCVRSPTVLAVGEACTPRAFECGDGLACTGFDGSFACRAYCTPGDCFGGESCRTDAEWPTALPVDPTGFTTGFGVCGPALVGPDNASPMPDELSVSMWVQAQPADAPTFWSKGEVLPNNPHIQLFLDPTGGLSVEIDDGVSSATHTTAAIAGDGSWHHIALTFDRTSSTAELYVDNLLDGGPVVMLDPGAIPRAMVIGGRLGTGDTISGGAVSIDDFVYQSTAVTSFDIDAGATAGSYPNAEVILPFDLSLTDLLGNQNASVFGTANAAYQDPALWGPGLAFDGNWVVWLSR